MIHKEGRKNRVYMVYRTPKQNKNTLGPVIEITMHNKYTKFTPRIVFKGATQVPAAILVLKGTNCLKKDL